MDGEIQRLVVYDYACPECEFKATRTIPFGDRDKQTCKCCNAHLARQLSAPMGRIAGRVVQGGGPDRFTADMLGIPLKELPNDLKAYPEKGES